MSFFMQTTREIILTKYRQTILGEKTHESRIKEFVEKWMHEMGT